MDLLGDGGLHVLEHLDLEEGAEEVAEKEAGRVHTLIGVGVTVVIRDTLIGHPEQLSCHVREKAGLLVCLL